MFEVAFMAFQAQISCKFNYKCPEAKKPEAGGGSTEEGGEEGDEEGDEGDEGDEGEPGEPGAPRSKKR